MHACAGSSVTALVERFANTHPSATEAEAMQSGFLPLFAVAGVDAIGADGRFINNPSLQLMVHLLIDPVRAQMLLEASDVVEARSLGVATPATPVSTVPTNATTAATTLTTRATQPTTPTTCCFHAVQHATGDIWNVPKPTTSPPASLSTPPPLRNHRDIDHFNHNQVSPQTWT